MYIGTANPFQGCEVYKYLDDEEDSEPCKPECGNKPDIPDCGKDSKHEKYDSKDKWHKCGEFEKEKFYKYKECDNHDCFHKFEKPERPIGCKYKKKNKNFWG